jgi:hypothetical protein
MEVNSEILDGSVQFSNEFFPTLANSDTLSSSSEDEEMNTACQEARKNNLPVSYNNQWLSYEGEIDLTSWWRVHRRGPRRHRDDL